MEKNYSYIKLFIACFFLMLFFNNSNAQWKASSGPYGGDILSLAGSGSDIYAGTMDGVYYSGNNGGSWAEVKSGFPSSTYVNSLLVKGTTVFAGTINNGMYSSANKGNSWTLLNTGISAKRSIYSFVLNGANIFAGTDSGVYISANDGASWTMVSNGLPGKIRINTMVINGLTIYAGTSNGLYASQNNGSTWTSVYMGIPASNVSSMAIIGSAIYATSGGALYTSSNNGSSWTLVKTNVPIGAFISFIIVNGADIFASTQADGIFMSKDGINWSAFNTGLPLKTQSTTLLINGTNIFAGTSNGVYVSSKTVSNWTNVSQGINRLVIWAITTSGSAILVGTHTGLYASSNNGGAWGTIQVDPTNAQISAFAANSTTLFAGTDSGVYSSVNNGASWSSANSGMPPNKETVALATNGTDVFASTWDGVVYSNNNGSSWTLANAGLPTSVQFPSSLLIVGKNIFAGTDSGIYVSGNNGTSWAYTGPYVSGYTFNMLLASSGNIIYAATSSSIYVSSNNGSSWSAITSFPTGVSINSIVTSGSNIIASTDKGIFVSGNNGLNWAPFNTGLNNLHIGSLFVSGNKIYAGDNRIYTAVLLNGTISKVDAICNGKTTGNATVNASGGTPPYKYAWNTNPVQTTATATNLPTGTDTVTVTDAVGYSIKLGTSVFVRTAPSSSFTTTSNGNVVNFNVGIPPKGIGYYWDFGDNSYSNIANPTHAYIASGGYTTILKTMDSSYVSCQSKQNKFVLAGTGGCNTAAEFSIAQDTTAKTISFLDKSTGKNLKWYWDFGNGESSSMQNPAPLKYFNGTICLTVRDTVLACQNRMCHDLKIRSLPDCQTKYLFFTDGINNKIQFDGKTLNTASSYYWSFGNGDYSTQANPSYIYTSPGFYKVCLSTRDSILPGCQSKYCDFVHAGNGDCKSKFNVLPDAASLNVNYSDASLGNATSWYWEFGDGHVSNLQSPGYKYTKPGFYQVCLTISKKGCQDTYFNTIHVGNNDCKTSFIFFTDSVKKSVEFKDLSLYGPTMWSWEFGDGTTSTVQNPQHTYTNAGIYTSCLNTMNAAGCINHYCEDIIIGPKGSDCQAAFETFAQNDSVSFKNKSIGTADKWFWDFGDQSTSSLINPSHVYTADGFYMVTLTMYNSAGGCFNTAYNWV
jgi:PKD repeat protein